MRVKINFSFSLNGHYFTFDVEGSGSRGSSPCVEITQNGVEEKHIFTGAESGGHTGMAVKNGCPAAAVALVTNNFKNGTGHPPTVLADMNFENKNYLFCFNNNYTRPPCSLSSVRFSFVHLDRPKIPDGPVPSSDVVHVLRPRRRTNVAET